MTMADPGFRSWVAYTIPSGAPGLGPSADLGGYRLSGLVLPPGWVTAAISFQAQDPASGTFFDLLADSVEVTFPSIAASKITVASSIAAALLAVRFIKIRSGTSASPVNQTGAPTITLLLDPVG